MPEIDSLHEALIEAVKACGGTKRVAAKLWPAKASQNLEAARRYLANCLNPECAEKLSLEEVMLILRDSRERNCHVAMQFLCASLGYADPQPVEPKDELAELLRAQNDLQREMIRRAERVESLMRQMQATTGG